MKTFKKIGEGLLIAGFVFLAIILVFESLVELPNWLKVAGRMHPMFLHFPIVLLLLSFLSLWIPSHEEAVWNWFDGLRLVATLSAVVTAIMGLLLSLEELEITRLLQWHKWGGVAIALLALIFYAYSKFFLRHKLAGKSFTLVAGLLIFLTGHWGAGLTHGDNYLLEPMAADRKIDLEDAVVFNDVIKPILQRKCLGCHREGNMKGGLLLENIEGIMKGGKTGPLFVAGSPEMSLLIQRIHLPVNEKKHMPPASKPDLTEDEAALLYTWIKSGALMREKLVDLPPQDSFRLLAARTFASEAFDPAAGTYDFPAADQKLISSLNNNYRVIQPKSRNSAALSVQFYGISNFSTKALQEVLPIKQQVTELNLARMPVKDDDLKIVSQFINLEKLNLNYTDVSGNGLQQLKSLSHLQTLSLSGTKLQAAALRHIDSLPALTKIFIWDTPIDSNEVAALKSRNKKWQIETGFVDNKEELIALPPPSFRVPAGVLRKPTLAELKHPIRGTEIRYTLDGTDPDSSKSEIYKKPLFIDSTVTLKARAFKEGWLGSSTVKASYVLGRLKADSLILLTKPDKNYSLITQDQLSDNDLGELNHSNGHWVGFHDADGVFKLQFNQPVEAKAVLLNLLLKTGSHVFLPVNIEIWGGLDEEEMKLLAKNSNPVPVKNLPAEMIVQQIKFPATSLRFIKIKLTRLKALPSWHDKKGAPAWILISEILVD